MASFSSLGPEVEIAAPGAEVCSTVPGEYDLLSGTSMAAPHVAGALATLLADGYSPSEAQQRLLESAEDLGHPDTDQGNGLLDIAAALGFDSGDDGTGDGIACPA
jgi:subtilisin